MGRSVETGHRRCGTNTGLHWVGGQTRGSCPAGETLSSPPPKADSPPPRPHPFAPGAGRGGGAREPPPYWLWFLFQIFRVEVLTSGRKHSVDRRFRDFQALHKKLKKTMKPPEFPPKRGLNRWPKALDQRRTGLETYLQTLLCSTQLVSQEILDFLNIKHVPSGKPPTNLRELGEVDLQNYRRFCHQVVTFTKDSFAGGFQSAEDLLPNVIMAGVLQGLYLTDPLAEIQPESSCAGGDTHQLTGLGSII
ncbi:sorting nexin-24-like [Narcine bancroftii]|uniref:sorting nexin-24-like n=1 Tax=Narcine bancroftii TaxID=1343680 RepID=UPI0038317CA7